MKDDIYEYYLIDETKNLNRNSGASRSFSLSMQGPVATTVAWNPKNPFLDVDQALVGFYFINVSVTMAIALVFIAPAIASRVKCVSTTVAAQFASK